MTFKLLHQLPRLGLKFTLVAGLFLVGGAFLLMGYVCIHNGLHSMIDLYCMYPVINMQICGNDAFRLDIYSVLCAPEDDRRCWFSHVRHCHLHTCPRVLPIQGQHYHGIIMVNS